MILGKIGGKLSNQILGTGIGALIVGLIINFTMSPDLIPTHVFLISMLSGVFWVIGQIGQCKALKLIGVSKTIPLTTGLQLIGTSIISIIFFGEWASNISKIGGVFAILLLIIGAVLTSFSEENTSKSTFYKGLMILILTSVGCWVYSALPKMVNASGLSIFFPQMLGVFIEAMIYTLFSNRSAFKATVSWKLIVID